MQRSKLYLIAAVICVAVFQRWASRLPSVQIGPNAPCSLGEIPIGLFYQDLTPRYGRASSSFNQDQYWVAANWGGLDFAWFVRDGGPEDWRLFRVVGRELKCDGRVVIRVGESLDEVAEKLEGLESPAKGVYLVSGTTPGTTYRLRFYTDEKRILKQVILEDGTDVKAGS